LLAGASLLAVATLGPPAHAQRYEFDYTGAAVSWPAPKAGKYQIVAFGAQGGDGCSLITTSGQVNIGAGGRGAAAGGNFTLAKGEILQIAVGGAGANATCPISVLPTLQAGGAGGGGTFVVRASDNAPLVIAGGGGGGGGGLGGLTVAGQGGTTDPGDGQGGATDLDLYGAGGGGGGFLSAGQSGASATGGGAYPGLAGGTGLFEGGFGGGGGASGGAGGGGGYSGGNGGGVHSGGAGAGGGGGTSDEGTSPFLIADVYNGNGLVVITRISPAKVAAAQ
jgi:hypothetical protein